MKNEILKRIKEQIPDPKPAIPERNLFSWVEWLFTRRNLEKTAEEFKIARELEAKYDTTIIEPDEDGNLKINPYRLRQATKLEEREIFITTQKQQLMTQFSDELGDPGTADAIKKMMSDAVNAYDNQ